MYGLKPYNTPVAYAEAEAIRGMLKKADKRDEALDKFRAQAAG